MGDYKALLIFVFAAMALAVVYEIWTREPAQPAPEVVPDLPHCQPEVRILGPDPLGRTDAYLLAEVRYSQGECVAFADTDLTGRPGYWIDISTGRPFRNPPNAVEELGAVVALWDRRDKALALLPEDCAPGAVVEHAELAFLCLDEDVWVSYEPEGEAGS